LTYPLRVFRPSEVAYETALRWQDQLAAEVRAGAPEALLILEHPPVYTLGRRPRYDHFLIPPDELRHRGAQVIETSRGGGVTFHGPGQVVAYPILNLRRRHIGPRDYAWYLEETMIKTIARFGIKGRRSPGRPGVWVDGAKLGALGVWLQGGVTSHGFALNVDLDLSWYDAIVPCGLEDATVTSLGRLLGHSPGVATVEDLVLASFVSLFDCALPACPPARLPAQTSVDHSNEPALTHGL
jgi:lipoate-protein ligase B